MNFLLYKAEWVECERHEGWEARTRRSWVLPQFIRKVESALAEATCMS